MRGVVGASWGTMRKIMVLYFDSLPFLPMPTLQKEESPLTSLLVSLTKLLLSLLKT